MAIKFVRVTVGDKHVCSDCISLEGEPEKTLDEWDASGNAPRVASTQCNGKCRCGLVPSTVEDIEEVGKARIKKLLKEVKENILTDLTHGRTIKLKDFESVKGLATRSYEYIANMESLITDWKVQNDFKALPAEFFKLADVEKMTEWLEVNIN